jgi:REP element-mobilizing transposase RayT
MMPRKTRFEYPDAFYHVMNKGRRAERIFFDQKDFLLFLGLLNECHRAFGLQVYAYCLMSNHYHLLLKTPLRNLSRIMRHLNGVFTQKINRKYRLEGSLFKGRYKAEFVETESYLMQLLCYIHLNPIKAYLEKKLGQYPWSSFDFYTNRQSPPLWLNTNELLFRFSRDLDAAGRIFEQHLHEQFYRKPRIDLEIAEKNPEPENASLEERVSADTVPASIEELLDKAMKIWNIDQVLITGKFRGSKGVYKRAFITYCYRFHNKSQIEISKIFEGMSQVAVSKQISQGLKEYSDQEGCYDRMNQLAELQHVKF